MKPIDKIIVETSRGNFHGIDGGEGKPALLFFHAFPMTSEIWLEQIEFFSDKYRVLAFDFRGLGVNQDLGSLVSIESHVLDMYAILEALKLEKVILVGISMGGYVALRFHEKYPASVEALVLCDTRSEADLNEGKIKRAEMMELVLHEGTQAFANAFVNSIFAPETLHNHRDAVDQVFSIVLAQKPESIAAHLMALAGRSDTTEGLKKINVPTLLVVGELDPMMPPLVMEGLQKKIKGSELKIMPAVGHLSALENPDLFNELLSSFLQSLP